MLTKLSAFLLALAILISLFARILGPSDIHDKEQPRTTAYTADMLINSHYVMPHDASGEPATKPPLYNWISLPVVALAGYQEWALRFPSLLAAGVEFLLLLWFAKWLAARPIPNHLPLTEKQTTFIGLLAASLWLVSSNSSRLIYLARPDMVLVACLTAAFATATMILVEENPRKQKLLSLALWIATALAALDKGPMALIPMLYIPFAAKSLTGKWSAANRTYWYLGIPFVFLTFAAWAYPAYLAEPQFFKQVLLGQEVAKRMVASPTFITEWWKVPQYTITPFLPWSLFALAGLLLIRPKNWFKQNPYASVFIWILLLMAGFSCIATKRADRFAPIFPASACLAAWVMFRLALHFKKFLCIPIAVLTMAIILTVYRFHYSEESKNHFGDNAVNFAAAVNAKVGNDPIAFYGLGQTPLETLLARHQDGDATPEQLAAAKWIIRPFAKDEHPLLTSAPLDQVQSPIREEPGALPVGLFPTQ